MGNSGESSYASKRPRVVGTAEEFERAFNELKYKYEAVEAENKELRGTIEDLLRILEDRYLSEEASSEEEDLMKVDESENGKEKVIPTRKETPSTRKKEKIIPTSKDKPSDQKKGKVIPMRKKDESLKKEGSKSVPVFTTYNVDIKSMVGLLETTLGHKNFIIKILGKSVSNVGVCTLEDYGKVKTMHVDQKVQFYTYTLKGMQPFSMVVEGIPNSFESSDILEYLNGLQIDIGIVNISRLGGDKWIVKLSRESDIKGFCDICYILHRRMRIRKFVKKGVTQCFN